MRIRKYLIWFSLLAIVLLAMSGAFTASAQCAMCRASLSGSNNATFIKNLNIGVLVLLVPPVTIFCSIFIILKRRGSGHE
ncbi:MAG TPA: hypothetical protein VGN86_06370 [Pyrinomonadaceae bacterium]|nr:hypothetical protein [Pyrinomonadaceae bacterium]